MLADAVRQLLQRFGREVRARLLGVGDDEVDVDGIDAGEVPSPVFGISDESPRPSACR